MTIYTLLASIISVAILIGYINHRFVGMQTTIAIMSSALLLSLVILISGHLGFHDLAIQVESTLGKINFHNLLMNGMLSFLLFAGALNVDINQLKNQKWEIGVLAILSTIVSTLLVGVLTYYLLLFLNLSVPLIYCFMFGALISPTDPIAVLATFKKLGAPSQLNVTVAGESLFNDGVGIVLFLTFYHLASTGTQPTIENVSLLFLQQAIGGIIYGAVIGLIAYFLIKPINDSKIEILITLAVVTGGYALAQGLGLSGPLAMVVAGIFIGNRGRNFSMSEETRISLDTFWELVDEVLNALLFSLIGLELLRITYTHDTIYASLIAIPLVLLVRCITVATPMWFFKRRRKYTPYFTSILIWGGLRGGLGVALALALPPSPHRSLILAMTYAVVMFSVIVQGLSVKPLVQLSKIN